MMLRLLAASLVASSMICGQASCDDLLAGLHKKPKQLEFVECKSRPDLQGKPLRATYRVKGANAAEVERYLSTAFGMQPLKNNCCLWESGQRTFQGKDGRVYYLSMGSGETPITQRAEWRKIPYFYVEFSQETEEP